MGLPSIELKENPLYTKSMLLTVYMRLVYVELLQNREYALRDQLTRSLRSVKNNINEAQSCESRVDFIHKLKIADKELHEAYGMMATELYCCPTFVKHKELLLGILDDISRLLSKSIYTARMNEKKTSKKREQDDPEKQ